jgi:hypothetical protein
MCGFCPVAVFVWLGVSSCCPVMAEQPTLLHTAVHTPAVEEASFAGNGIGLFLSAVASRSSGKTSAHRAAVLPRQRVAGGGGLALPRWLRGC